VIIGPQSSGKSTICKIACYCSWVEKKVCLNQSFAFFEKNGTFHAELVRFHKLKGYFRDDSYIEYESDVIRFTYTHKEGVPAFEWRNRYGYKRGKIAYIPSERNLIAAIRNWFEVKFEDNNIRNFMIDWTDARKTYTEQSPLPILKLGVRYYFDEASERDLVLVDNNGTTLDLTNTSSGLQSVIPLEVVAEYMMARLYNSKESHLSVNDERLDQFLAGKIYDDLFKPDKIVFPAEGGTQELPISTNGNWTTSPEEVPQTKQTTISIRTTGSYIRFFKSEEDRKNHLMVVNQMLTVQHTKLYIEEPEQNIFPETQRDILYYFLQLAGTKEDHGLFITTHSPYILLALNNCILGYLVKDKMPEEERNELKSFQACVDPALVSAYEITSEGTLRSIQNERTRTVGKHYFNRISNGIMDEYYDMLNYLEMDSDEGKN
jgi:hypothetical protein